MMFFIIILLFFMKKYDNYKLIMINKNTFSIVKYNRGFNNINNQKNGYDNRFPDNATINITEIQIISNFLDNKKKLDLLKNNNVSITKKLEVITDNNIKPADLLNAGLMRDFEFEI